MPGGNVTPMPAPSLLFVLYERAGEFTGLDA
jgi:hypothetical protein